MDISSKVRNNLKNHRAFMAEKLNSNELSAYDIGVLDAIGAIDAILDDYALEPKDSAEFTYVSKCGREIAYGESALDTSYVEYVEHLETKIADKVDTPETSLTGICDKESTIFGVCDNLVVTANKSDACTKCKNEDGSFCTCK